MKNNKNINYKNNNINMKLKIIFSLIFLFIFIPMINAEIDTNRVDDVFQVNSHIAYTKPCFNNGTYCSSSAECNYTFYDRNNNILANNVAANQVGVDGASTWQYNFTRGEVGLYKVDMVCIDDGEQGSETLYYQITGDGRNNSVAFYVIILLIAMVIIAAGFLIPDGWITILGTFPLYFVGIEILRFGIAGMKNLTSTWAIGIVLICIASYISIKSGMEMMYA